MFEVCGQTSVVVAFNFCCSAEQMKFLFLYFQMIVVSLLEEVGKPVRSRKQRV